MKTFKNEKTIIIGNLKIGNNYRPKIIAEGCDNHFGKLNRALKMVSAAKKAGADIIKFQHHLPDEEMLPVVPKSKNFNLSLYEFLKKYALKLEDHIKIKKKCESIGIQYLCTPFSLKAALELKKIGVDAFKIGSGEMTDIPSLKEIAKFNLPLIISTGMSQLDEIKYTYKNIVKINKKLIFMNCTSEYPPIYKDINLKVIPVLKKMLSKALIGHSDHSSSLVTSYGAVTLGAVIIEKHVALDKNDGPDSAVSISFQELADMIKNIKNLYFALGDKKKINPREKQIRKWAFRSIISLRRIKKGEKITKSMIWSKRPGTGIPSKKMNEIIGREAKSDIPQNSLIKWSQLL
tara:strand:+ start:7312 stop:8355 length:1044 start_codon:yes stop_codon:yes gene_type:complete